MFYYASAHLNWWFRQYFLFPPKPQKCFYYKFIHISPNYSFTYLVLLELWALQWISNTALWAGAILGCTVWVYNFGHTGGSVSLKEYVALCHMGLNLGICEPGVHYQLEVHGGGRRSLSIFISDAWSNFKSVAMFNGSVCNTYMTWVTCRLLLLMTPYTLFVHSRIIYKHDMDTACTGAPSTPVM